MLDLTQHELIPLKTLAKRRNGDTALFVCELLTRPGRERKFRFISQDRADSTGSHEMYKSGMFNGEGERESPFDIVSIAKKRELRDGDIVKITGMVCATNVRNEYDYVTFVKDLELPISYMSDLPARGTARGGAGEFWHFNWSCPEGEGDRGGNWQWTANRKDITFVRRDT